MMEAFQERRRVKLASGADYETDVLLTWLKMPGGVWLLISQEVIA